MEGVRVDIGSKSNFEDSLSVMFEELVKMDFSDTADEIELETNIAKLITYAEMQGLDTKNLNHLSLNQKKTSKIKK